MLDTFKYALQQNARHCFKLIPAPPPSWGEKYTILNQSTLWSAPCACLVPATKTQAFHLSFKVAEEVWGMGLGKKGKEAGSRRGVQVECKKREKQTNKQTNGMEWVKGDTSCSLISRSVGWAVPCKACPVSPLCIFFFFLIGATSHAGKILVIPHIFYPQKSRPALRLAIEAVALVYHCISGSQGCLPWEKLDGHVPKSALHALLFLLSVIRAHTERTQ